MIKVLMAVVLTLFLTVSTTEAYCEHGYQVNREFVGGGYLVSYDFGQGRILSFKFPSGASIPYSIRFDFYKWELCY